MLTVSLKSQSFGNRHLKQINNTPCLSSDLTQTKLTIHFNHTNLRQICKDILNAKLLQYLLPFQMIQDLTVKMEAYEKDEKIPLHAFP